MEWVKNIHFLKTIGMKISRNLLQAILVGATLGATVSSCATVRENSEIVYEHTEECDEKCSLTHDGKDDAVKVEFNCPACGRG